MSDTTQTATTESEEQRKRAKLRELFPPQFVEWDAPGILFTSPGGTVVCTPYVTTTAIADRLDAVLGADNWRETYENPGDYTRCRLEVRFQAGGDWVSRNGVSNVSDPKEAHAESLRAAAGTLGIGRYLSNLTQTAEVVATGAVKGLKARPKLPQHYLPHAYQTCNRETASKCRELINQACEESGKRGRAIDKKAAAVAITKQFGLTPNGDGNVFLSDLTNGQVGEIIQLAHAWIAEIAKGELSGLSCPVKLTQNNSPQGKPAQTQAPQGKSAQAANAK